VAAPPESPTGDPNHPRWIDRLRVLEEVRSVAEQKIGCREATHPHDSQPCHSRHARLPGRCLERGQMGLGIGCRRSQRLVGAVAIGIAARIRVVRSLHISIPARLGIVVSSTGRVSTGIRIVIGCIALLAMIVAITYYRYESGGWRYND